MTAPPDPARPAPGAPRRVVYLSYDGMDEPLGRSQVLPYLRRLGERGHRFELLSFEKPGTRLRFREPLGPAIRWTALRYHRRPTVPATLFDLSAGTAVARLLAARSGADLVHVRGHVMGAMALPLCGRHLPLLLDTRGMIFEERVDTGAWARDGGLYRTAKQVERVVFRRADGITTLTLALQRWLRQEYPRRADLRAPIRVIPTCADLERFHPDAPRDTSLTEALAGARVLCYLGSFGGFYQADAMARFYLHWRRGAPPARFLVVSRQAPQDIARVLAEAGLAHELVHVAATHDQVPGLLRWAEAGVLFFHALFSKRGSAPTKSGEMLGCGVPVAINPIGDAATLFEGSAAGVFVPSTDEASLARAAADLSRLAADPQARLRARALAERWFSLDAAVDAYDRLYRELRRPGEPLRPLPDAGWPPAPVCDNDPGTPALARVTPFAP